MEPGPPETRARNCNRDGAAYLTAVLDVAAGFAAEQLVERRRSEEFLAFLDHIFGGIGPGPQFTPFSTASPLLKPAEVSQWLKDRPARAFHSAPASWMNAVDGFLTKFSRRRLKPAIFNSLDECVKAIKGRVECRNANYARPVR